VSGSVSNTDIN